jgi:DNA-binding CsgD family transcriptional regulator
MRKLAAAGADDVEIAWRFRRTPRTVRNMRDWSELPRQAVDPRDGTELTPIERRVLRWRDDGVAVEELAARFRHRPAYLEQVEQIARYKRGH